MPFEAGIHALRHGNLASSASPDAESRAGALCDDGEIHPCFGLPALGREATPTTHTNWISYCGEDKRLDILSAGVRADLGYVLMRQSTDPSERPEAGTSLEVLAGHTAGQWRFRLSSLISDFEDIDTEMETP